MLYKIHLISQVDVRRVAKWGILLLFLLVTDSISYSSFTGKSGFLDESLALGKAYPVPFDQFMTADSLWNISAFGEKRPDSAGKGEINTVSQNHIFNFLNQEMQAHGRGDSLHFILIPGLFAEGYYIDKDTFQSAEALYLSLYHHIEPRQKSEVKPKQEKSKSRPKNYLLTIMGKGELDSLHLRDFLLEHNDSIDTTHVLQIVKLYIEEAEKEGVNHDIAFIQMCHETDFLKYTGVVKPSQNNFCGLGTVNDDTPGETFASAQEGIRAHIQHLKAYASKQDVNHELVDNRFYFVERGIAPVVEKLTGRWATDSLYHQKIRKLFRRLEDFAESKKRKRAI